MTSASAAKAEFVQVFSDKGGVPAGSCTFDEPAEGRERREGDYYTGWPSKQVVS